MDNQNYRLLSPIDARYQNETKELGGFLSEWALMRYRVLVEVKWLIAMARNRYFGELRSLTEQEAACLLGLYENFDDSNMLRIKEIERTTNHDVKAVEYYIKEQMARTSMTDIKEFVHFGCTSEDINNLAYALMLKHALTGVWLPKAGELSETVAKLAKQLKDVSILSHTHGQPATPTTLGKELAVFVYRWNRQLAQAEKLEFMGKFNGVVGNFNAQAIAYPDLDWESVAKRFVGELGLVYNPLTTQIEPHDYMAEIFHLAVRFNNITMDFCRDIWSYISLGYFKQLLLEGEVGSSTMPHKINPINFETAEANLGLSNSMLLHLAGKLQISRMQRDLSDSSAQRNIGSALGYSVTALCYAIKGIMRLDVDLERIKNELNSSWEVLAEAVQTVMRKCGYNKPYEKLKELTRGRTVTQNTIREFIGTLDLPEKDKNRLLELTPGTYTGIAGTIVENIFEFHK
jgi:adenylosuccinate lyase